MFEILDQYICVLLIFGLDLNIERFLNSHYMRVVIGNKASGILKNEKESRELLRAIIREGRSKGSEKIKVSVKLGDTDYSFEEMQ